MAAPVYRTGAVRSRRHCYRERAKEFLTVVSERGHVSGASTGIVAQVRSMFGFGSVLFMLSQDP